MLSFKDLIRLRFNVLADSMYSLYFYLGVQIQGERSQK